MMLAGAFTAARARPGATRPTAVVTPMSRPVARARRPDRGRRPGGGPPEAGSSRRSRDGAIRDAKVVRDTEGAPCLEVAGRAGHTGGPCAMGLSDPVRRRYLGRRRLWTPRRPARNETLVPDGSGRCRRGRCLKPRSPCKTDILLAGVLKARPSQRAVPYWRVLARWRFWAPKSELRLGSPVGAGARPGRGRGMDRSAYSPAPWNCRASSTPTTPRYPTTVALPP